MKPIILTCLLAVVLLAGCGERDSSSPDKTVWLYAGAGMRRAVDALAKAFEEKTGTHVEVQYGGSGMLLNLVPQRERADIFMPGDVWYVDRLQELTGGIESKTSVAWFVPVVIVSKRESTVAKKIRSIEDFSRDDIRLALGNPKACQIGRITGKILKANGIDPASVASRTKYSLTVNELATWVKMDNADAAIVWDAVAANVAEDVEIIEIPKEKNVMSHVVAGQLAKAKNPEGARAFIEFMTSPQGQSILQGKGFRTSAP
jgi:molybdate transport system substrate-binding protein